MEITQYIIGILGATCLASGWIGVQIIARKMKTKNHFDNMPSSCSDLGRNCECGDSECRNEKILRKV